MLNPFKGNYTQRRCRKEEICRNFIEKGKKKKTGLRKHSQSTQQRIESREPAQRNTQISKCFYHTLNGFGPEELKITKV